MTGASRTMAQSGSGVRGAAAEDLLPAEPVAALAPPLLDTAGMMSPPSDPDADGADEPEEAAELGRADAVLW